jgi:hypothetical protein
MDVPNRRTEINKTVYFCKKMAVLKRGRGGQICGEQKLTAYFLNGADNQCVG